MHDQGVELLEAALVREHVNALTGGEFAAIVLGLDAALTTTLRGLFLAAVQVLKSLLDAQRTSREAAFEPLGGE
jgi:hypothetical protein